MAHRLKTEEFEYARQLELGPGPEEGLQQPS